MSARATSRRRSFSERLVTAVFSGALAAGVGWVAAPVEAATAVHVAAKAGKKKAHRPSRAHRKMVADLAKAKADDFVGGGELGAASYYGFGFHGRRVANGERFNVRALTAASNRYPLGSWVAVRRLDSDRCIVVRINDRMHVHHRTRIIDLSRAAAEQLRMLSAGVVLVRVARLPAAPEEDPQAACRTVFGAGLVDEPTCADCQQEMPAEADQGTVPVPEGVAPPALPPFDPANRQDKPE